MRRYPYRYEVGAGFKPAPRCASVSLPIRSFHTAPARCATLVADCDRAVERPAPCHVHVLQSIEVHSPINHVAVRVSIRRGDGGSSLTGYELLVDPAVVLAIKRPPEPEAEVERVDKMWPRRDQYYPVLKETPTAATLQSAMEKANWTQEVIDAIKAYDDDRKAKFWSDAYQALKKAGLSPQEIAELEKAVRIQ